MSAAGMSTGGVRKFVSGWWLIGAVTGAIALVLALLVVAHGANGDVMRLAIRITARTSLVLFGLAFCASGAYALWPGAATGWQLANRRYLGLAFAGSHLLHALAIIGYATVDPINYTAYMSVAMYLLGGVAYVFIALMALTSFDSTARLLGPTAWRWLHVIGSYYVWLSFFNGFGRRAVADATYWPWIGFVVLVMAIRLAGKSRIRSSREAAR